MAKCCTYNVKELCCKIMNSELTIIIVPYNNILVAGSFLILSR